MYYYRKNRDKLLRKNGELKLMRHTKTRIWDIYDAHKEKMKSYYKGHKNEFLQCRDYLTHNFKGYKDVIWHICYAASNGILDGRYIPEDIYYTIVERELNNYDLAFSYMDKNIYKRLQGDIEMPGTVLRIINGRLYDGNYNALSLNEVKRKIAPYEVLIFKPAIESGGGMNIRIDTSANILEHIKTVLNDDRKATLKNYIIQEVIKQSEQTAFIHPNSVNTLRIMTFRKNEKIVHLSSILRMGRGNSVVDNERSGGISCGIEPDGSLKEFAYDKDFNRYDKHPDTNIPFKGHRISSYKQALNICFSMHSNLFHFDIISWDIAIGEENKPVFIEFNLLGQSINFHQLNNGPLFGEHTSYLIENIFKNNT